MIAGRASFRARLPATSANLGPGFDAVGLALSLFLDIEAEALQADASDCFSIDATGRNPEQVGSLEGNLMVNTYRQLAPQGPALRLRIDNEIPLGMGCGSSAAALLGGVLLANHFGALGWSGQQVMEEACRLEGHPDNVAACFLGGLTVSAMEGGRVTAATLGDGVGWPMLLALPARSLATEKARALLPDFYSRADVVQNIQATALLVAAFALGKPELLAAGTRDRVHQPYRADACPLYPALAGLAGSDGVLAVTLSGAGPAVLLVLSETADQERVEEILRVAAGDPVLEVLQVGIAAGAVYTAVERQSNITKE